MKKISCVEQGEEITREDINREIKRVGIDKMGIVIPDEIVDFYVNQNIKFSYHRVIKIGDTEYGISYFDNMINNGMKNTGIIDTIPWFRSFEEIGENNMIVFNEDGCGNLFFVSYGKHDYGKVYYQAMDEGEDAEPVLLANSFGEFIDALEVDPEDMESLMELPEDKRGDLS